MSWPTIYLPSSPDLILKNLWTKRLKVSKYDVVGSEVPEKTNFGSNQCI